MHEPFEYEPVSLEEFVAALVHEPEQKTRLSETEWVHLYANYVEMVSRGDFPSLPGLVKKAA